MLKEAINLCLALYRITDLFPKEEPLRLKLREASLKIISIIVFVEDSYNLDENKEDKNKSDYLFRDYAKQFGIIYAFMDIARSQRWVHRSNFDILVHAYDELEKRIQRERGRSVNVLPKKNVLNKESSQLLHKSVSIDEESSPIEALNTRQKKLLAEIQKEGSASPMAFFVKFPNVNPRTILRDIEKLEVLHFIKGKGSTRSREYYVSK